MNEYSVYQWFIDGSREDVLKFVSDEEAVQSAARLCTSVGARIGTTVRVIITDGMDECCWEWKREEGIVFPQEFAGMLKNGVNS